MGVEGGVVGAERGGSRGRWQQRAVGVERDGSRGRWEQRAVGQKAFKDLIRSLRA